MADQARIAPERTMVRGVVQVDAVGVNEVEFDVTKRRLGTGLLLQPGAAIVGVDHNEVITREIARIGPLLGEQLLLGDVRRNVPRRVQDDALDRRLQHRRLVAWPAGGRPHRQHRCIVVEDGEHRRGDIHLDAVGRQGRWQPAPALHIGDDLADPFVHRHVEGGQRRFTDGAGGLQAKPLLRAGDAVRERLIIDRRASRRDGRVLRRQPGAQRGDARPGRAELQVLAGRDLAPATVCGDAAIGGQAAAQLVIAGVGRRQAIQPGAELVLGHGLDEAWRARVEGVGPQPHS